MNRTILMDRIWNIYSYFPHCIISKNRCVQKAREAFAYNRKKDISIISVNCVGGEIYSILGIPFLSPLINTSMNRKEFITMCRNLKEYMNSKLEVHKQDENRFIGILCPDGLEPVGIRFDHDDNEIEIQENWNKRRDRINWDNVVLICDDKDINDEDYDRYDSIKDYKKIMLTASDMSGKYDWCYQLKAYQNKQRTGTYNGKSLRGGWKFLYMWDFVSFLNS